MQIQLLEPSEVAEALKVSKSLVYSLIRNGELKSVKFGKTVRVRPEDLENFINEKLTGTSELIQKNGFVIPNTKRQ